MPHYFDELSIDIENYVNYLKVSGKRVLNYEGGRNQALFLLDSYVKK